MSVENLCSKFSEVLIFQKFLKVSQMKKAYLKHTVTMEEIFEISVVDEDAEETVVAFSTTNENPEDQTELISRF